MSHLLSGEPRGTVPHLLRGYIDGETACPFELALEPSPSSPADAELAERLLRAFTYMTGEEEKFVPASERPSSGVWEAVKHAFHGELYGLLYKEDVTGLAAYLRNSQREVAANGLGLGPDTFKALEKNLTPNKLLLVDRIVSAAIALGALPEENPEQGRYGQNLRLPFNEIVSALEGKTGPFSRPRVAGLYGAAWNGQIIDYRAPEDAYAVSRLRAVTTTGKVAEIGGGFGGVAFQAIRSGMESYTVYDLPLVIVLQGWFVVKALGGSAVGFLGEDNRHTSVQLLPYWCFNDRKIVFDTVFNRDSMAEFPLHVAESYVKEIAARGAKLISINQEVEGESGQSGVLQLNVGNIATQNLKRQYRFPYWIRKGYVEELFA